MDGKPWYRKKRIWIGAALVALAAVIAYAAYQGSRPSPEMRETVAVRRGMLERTVEATGAVKAASEFALDFDTAGRVKDVFVEVGEEVKAGQVLAELDASEIDLEVRRARAVLAVAVANLNQKLAGEAPEAIRASEADVAKAAASLTEAQTTLANLRRTTALDVRDAELDVAAAEIALTQAQRDQQDSAALDAETLIKKYDTARADLLKAVVTFSTALNDMDVILGVDSTTANDAFESILGAQRPPTVEAAKNAYLAAKARKAEADAAVLALSVGSSASAVDAAFAPALAASEAFTDALAKTREVLDATAPSSQFTLTELNTKKTTISTDRTGVATDYGTMLGDRNGIATTRIENANGAHDDAEAVEDARIALDQARHALEAARLDAETTVAAQEAAVAVAVAGRDGVQATLDLKKAALRASDRGPLDAAVEEARAAVAIAEEGLRKARIVAPADGIITDVAVSPGEDATPRVATSGAIQSTSAVTMLGTFAEIEADVSENDITQVSVGLDVTLTLDAFGNDRVFRGRVIAVNPAETLIQDVVYYKVRIAILDDGPDIRPGMTANITLTGTRKDGVLIVPFRAAREVDGTRVVRVEKADGSIEDRTVTLGLRGDGGLVEIVDGLAEGETVIVSIRPASP